MRVVARGAFAYSADSQEYRLVWSNKEWKELRPGPANLRGGWIMLPEYGILV